MTQTSRTLRTCAALALLLLPGLAREAAGAEHYFVLIFGSQSRPKRLEATHTWATFVRAVGEGTDPNAYRLSVHTISWLPASGDVRVWAARPEPGVNRTLEQTLAYVYARDERVRLWGPFVIGVELYNRSVAVYNALQGGAVQYRAISTNANLLIADCIHAVAAVDPDFGRGHYPLIRVGIPASRYIAREIVLRGARRGVDPSAHDVSWLLPRLGLTSYPIEYVPPGEVPAARCLLCRCPE
jgi:hypothetical protein